MPLLIALYRRYSFMMRIYTDRVSVEEGFFAKETSEFFIKDIRSIDVRQGVWGRLVGIGDVTISMAATVDAAEEAHGVPQPNRIKDLLIGLTVHHMAVAAGFSLALCSRVVKYLPHAGFPRLASQRGTSPGWEAKAGLQHRRRSAQTRILKGHTSIYLVQGLR